MDKLFSCIVTVKDFKPISLREYLANRADFSYFSELPLPKKAIVVLERYNGSDLVTISRTFKSPEIIDALEEVRDGGVNDLALMLIETTGYEIEFDIEAAVELAERNV